MPVSADPPSPRRAQRRSTRVFATVGRMWFASVGPEHEQIFLTYQRELRDGGSKVLNEAMLVLDIIDVKTQSLLAYISISLAAMVFLITALPTSTNLHFDGLSKSYLTIALLLVIILLLSAILLCLSCLNIVGAHTIRMLAGRKKETQSEYETLIVGVTLARRKRYLVAHRISLVTAILTMAVFLYLLAGSLRAL
jgi:hypothetical protein